MKLNETKIIAIVGILVLSVFIGLLIRISLKEPLLKSKQISLSAQPSVEFSKPLLETMPKTLSAGFQELNIPVLPIPKPNTKAISKEKPLPSTIAPFFEKINKAAKTVEKLLMPNNAPSQKTSITTSDGIILSLTEKQFHFLYPDNFIAGLIDSQNFFIKEYDPAYEPLLKIETDPQVRFVEEKIVTALLTANMITKEQAERFITTIRFTLPQLQLIDLKMNGSYGFYESGKIESWRTAKGSFFAGLIMLTNELAHKAQAFCGSCSTSPECFQEGAAAPGVAGTETFKAACYCTGCLSSLGCLSSYQGQAAIYDPETGICGSGLGGGGGGGI